ncbi:ATP synthase subunit s, mitochondrial-like [Coccinella septempunctata]|uniref:ATP synthase subunit s, mitochondrial-like n=1 Tax=Coccinella septempunctata TaxID=41139 RepID=UPI001D080148|nr:ATP synthase subunit s, mitochondrial-like [Coccinella septempunctata]
MMQVTNTIFRRLCVNNVPCARNLFGHVLNKVFNAVDEDRRKKFGPDRSCAEWLLRNGASVKFKGSSELLTDYNSLPDEDFPLTIAEVEAVDSSISQYGFGNFRGCKQIWKIAFVRCNLLDNGAMKELSVLTESLRHLKISNCPDITDDGLLHLQSLKLTDLELYNLPYVKDKETVLQTLKSSLPKCNIILE